MKAVWSRSVTNGGQLIGSERRKIIKDGQKPKEVILQAAFMAARSMKAGMAKDKRLTDAAQKG